MKIQKNQKALIRHNFIYQKLVQGKIVNVKALADEFGVGERTIQKDLNERLCEIYNIQSLGEGNYQLDRHHHMQISEEDESIAISLMKALQHSAMPEIDTYIDTSLHINSDYSEIFTFTTHLEQIEDIESFKLLIKAIKWKVGVEFTYTKVDGSSKKVLADPYRLANFQNYWYLIAYDPSALVLKNYYLKNISKLKMLYENFTGNEKIEKELKEVCSNMESVWWNNERQSCLLEVSGKAKYYIERDLPDNMKIVEVNDEYLLASYFYHNELEILPYVKSWLPHIRIVNNEELNNTLKYELELFLEK